MFKILTLTLNNMSKYELKKGYVAQFNIPFKGVKSFTNKQITDELAMEYLKRFPERIIFFSKTPHAPSPVPKSIKIVPVIKSEAEINSNDDIGTAKPEVAEAVNEVMNDVDLMAGNTPEKPKRPRSKSSKKSK